MAEPAQVAAETQTEGSTTQVQEVVTATPTIADVITQIQALQQENARLSQQVQSVGMQVIQQPLPAEPKAAGDLTDEQLWGLAQQGNRQAFEMYQERIADRRFEQKFRGEQQGAVVRSQLAALYAAYPELRDPQHPLTQRAVAFKNVLISMGEPGNASKTDLDAILRAVADSRAMLARPAPGTSAARQTSVGGQIAATPAPSARLAAVEPEVSEAAKALASRMGIKDPGGAMKRFEERQKKGLSSVSPLIAAAVREG